MNNIPQFHDVIELWEQLPENKDRSGKYPAGYERYIGRYYCRQHIWEGIFLWKYCQQANGDMLEIGRSRGGSTALMLAATGGTSRRLTSIDIRSDEEVERCVELISKHKDRYICIVGDSRTATVSHDYGLLFIDGNHMYDNVKLDTERHWDKLHTGGIAVYHDYLSPKWGPEHVGKFIDEWIAAGKAKKLGVCGTAVALEKI